MKRLTNIQRKIVDFIQVNGGKMTVPELCLQLSIDREKAYNWLKKLKSKGLLESRYFESEDRKARVLISLKEYEMLNIITVPKDMTIEGHDIKAGQRIEIVKSKSLEKIGENTFKVLKDIDTDELQLKAGQIFKVLQIE